MNSFKTPIAEILFRSSKIGLLAGGLIRHGLTEKQRQEMDKLLETKKTFIGLSDKQQADLDKLNNDVKEGKNLTQTAAAKREDFTNRLTTFKDLTPKQEETLQKYIEQNAKPPELSQGAKTYIKEVWLFHEKGFQEEVTDKKLRKGIKGEEDGINLISFVDGRMYINNNTSANGGRVTKGNLTGACDVKHFDKGIDATIIDDIKCSWNPRTFMSAAMTTAYEWQGRAYLYLYSADIFRLRHCLVDCPPDVYADEFKKFCWNHNIIDETLPEYKDLIDQFNRNYLYEHSGNYTQVERVKTFFLARDEELEAVLLKSIELGIEYYKTITLNMIEND